MGSLFPFRPALHDCEWVGGRHALPGAVREGDAVMYPDVDLWLELPGGAIVGSQIVDPRENVPFGDSLTAAMKQPM